MTGIIASRRLIVIWVLLATLIATIVVVQRNDAPSTPSEQSNASDVRWLLPAPIEQIGAIEVAHAGVIDRLERDGSGAWFYHGAHTGQQVHQADTATAQYIEHTLAGFGRAQIERTFPIGGGVAGGVELEDGASAGQTYGVTVPSLIVLVYAPGKTEPWVQYAIGNVTPDGYGRYVLPVGSSSVVTIANYQITNLLNLIAEVANPGMTASKQGAQRDAPAS